MTLGDGPKMLPIGVNGSYSGLSDTLYRVLRRDYNHRSILSDQGTSVI